MENARPTVRALANGLMDVFPKLDDTKRRVALSSALSKRASRPRIRLAQEQFRR